MRRDDAPRSDAQVVERLHGAFAGHDLAAALTCLDEDVYFVLGGHETARSRGDFSGHEGFRAWWELEISGGLDLAVLQVCDLGAGVFLADVMSGAPSGEGAVTLLQGWVYTIAGGVIEAIEVFDTPTTALRGR